jgi:outer membrane autotransporter protein
VLVGGRAAGLAFLAQRGGWLADHSYQSADLALDENRSERAWVPFGGVDVGRWRLDTGSRIRLTSSNMLLGFATRHRGDSGVALLGVFLEAGKADYDTRNHFAFLPSIEGDGDLDAIGGGLMARHTWNNDFRFEASLRTGRLKNDFRTKHYEDEEGIPARYKSTDHYLAAHLGVGREWQISEKNRFDLLFRYYWTRLDGGKVTLSNGERIRFREDDSHRIRIGARLTHLWKENRFWYLGVAAERELDSKVRVNAIVQDGANTRVFALDTHDFKGTTGIGEIGVIIRSRKNSPFSLEAGLQGYAGKFRGISGGIRLGWEF